VLCTDITFSDGRVTFRYYPQAAASFNAGQWHEAMELQKGYYLKQFQLIETYLSILRSQEETYFSQLKDVYCSIFGGTQQDIPDESIANDIRYFINNGDIEGKVHPQAEIRADEGNVHFQRGYLHRDRPLHGDHENKMPPLRWRRHRYFWEHDYLCVLF
jgi:hypothetical protein